MSLKKNKLVLLLVTLFVIGLTPFQGWGQEKLGLTIKDSIEMALKNNPTILSADHSVGSAEASLKVATAGALPKLDLNINTTSPTLLGQAEQTTTIGQVETTTEFEPTLALGGNLSLSYLLPTAGNFTFSLATSFTRSKTSKITVDGEDKTPDPNDPTFTTKPSVSLRVDQPLFVDGFALALAAIDQANANLAIARSGRAETRSDLAFNVASAYYNLIRARKLVEVSQATVVQAESSLAISQEQASLGAITEVDVKKSEVQLGSALSTLITARSGAIKAANIFYNLLKLDPAVELELTEEIRAEPVGTSLSEAIDGALVNRQDIIQAKERVRISETNVIITSRDSKPSLTLGGGYNLSGSDKDFVESLSKTKGENWNVSLGLTLPLYDGEKGAGSAQKALHDLEQAKIGLETLEDGIVLEVKNIFQSITEAESKIKVSRDNVALAQDNLEIDKGKFEVGGISRFQLSATELAFTNAQTDVVNATIDYNVAQVNLAKAMGVELIK